MPTAAQANERTVRGLFEDVINGQEYDRVSRYCAPDVAMHRPGGVVTVGRDDYESHYRELHAAFPDFEATLSDLLADTDRVATRFVVTGTHEGELLGIAPTGRRVQFPAQVLFRLDEGTITEEFHQSDRRSLRTQLSPET